MFSYDFYSNGRLLPRRVHDEDGVPFGERVRLPSRHFQEIKSDVKGIRCSVLPRVQCTIEGVRWLWRRLNGVPRHDSQQIVLVYTQADVNDQFSHFMHFPLRVICFVLGKPQVSQTSTFRIAE